MESEGGRFVCFGRDISERKKAAAEILYLQKAESLGRMAGAVAHHYNNLMQIINGNLEMAREDLLPGNSGPAGNIAEAMQAARRASHMGGMMLAYLGHTIAPQEPLDLAETCRGFLPGFREDMPASITLEADLPGPGLIVLANAGQIRQILEILITNAWEAMGGRSGRISLNLGRTAPVDIPLIHRHPVDFQAGKTDYACLEVKDSGEGIGKKDIEKIFEPFYSTRFTGRGLGLPVALGAIKRHKGCITVTTVPDQGSAFQVYLPVLPG
jgi:signal transduction histidine kinase